MTKLYLETHFHGFTVTMVTVVSYDIIKWKKHSNFLENQAEKVESWGGFQSLTYFTKKKHLMKNARFLRVGKF